MVNFLMNNWIAILAALGSFGSFIIAYRVKIQTEAPIEAIADPQLEWIIMLLGEDGRSIVNKNGLAMFNITVINPSNADVSYFDLRVIDQENNEELNFYKKEQLSKINNASNMEIRTAINKKHSSYIELPSGITGMLKAHSVTVLSIVVTPKENTKQINTVFKIARRHPLFKKNKYGYALSKYEAIFVSSVLDKSSKPDYQKLLTQDNDEEHHL